MQHYSVFALYCCITLLWEFRCVWPFMVPLSGIPFRLNLITNQMQEHTSVKLFNQSHLSIQRLFLCASRRAVTCGPWVWWSTSCYVAIRHFTPRFHASNCRKEWGEGSWLETTTTLTKNGPKFPQKPRRLLLGIQLFLCSSLLEQPSLIFSHSRRHYCDVVITRLGRCKDPSNRMTKGLRRANIWNFSFVVVIQW